MKRVLKKGFTLLEVTVSLTLIGLSCPLFLAGLGGGCAKVKKCSFEREAAFLVQRTISEFAYLNEELNFNDLEEPIGLLFPVNGEELPVVVMSPSEGVENVSSQLLILISKQENVSFEPSPDLMHLKISVQRPAFLPEERRQCSHSFHRSIRL